MDYTKVTKESRSVLYCDALINSQGFPASTTMISILMLGQPHARSTAFSGAVAPLTDNLLIIVIDGVVDKCTQLDILMSVFVLFSSSVLLTFLFLLAAFEREH